ncbi:MAG: allophanate hydrolase [Microbacteriaceae bacterium]|jgi:biotin-dependent carboxylase-like uncharacterized protein|nr:allophanate hydrolase [Microbacteriaceae bacterium]
MTMTGFVEIIDPGPFTTVQDLGRPGYAHLGVSTSGAADLASHSLANRIVGNPPTAAGIEILLGGFSARLTEGRWCSVAGATVGVTVDSHPVPEPSLFFLPAASILRLDPATTGLRAYLAIEGGIVGNRVLGSASWDSLGNFGTRPATSGTQWELLQSDGEPRYTGVVPTFEAPATLTLGFFWGPRDHLLDKPSRDVLLTTRWTVTNDCDRVGARLSGSPLAVSEGSLPSEGCVVGSIQVPPTGLPIVFLADHPVTGGYPVVGVITETAAAHLAQARPGTYIQFRSQH